MDVRPGLSRSLTIREAVATLRRDARQRSVRETPAAFGGMEDRAACKRLVDPLIQGSPEAKRDPVEKNARTWMKEGTLVIGRDNAIQLAFALELSLQDADQMITHLCGEGFHWRAPEGIAWSFGLMSGFGLCPNQGTPARLGRVHNTACGLFREIMDLLGQPRMEDGPPDADAMSAREIISAYMYENRIPLGLARRSFISFDWDGALRPVRRREPAHRGHREPLPDRHFPASGRTGGGSTIPSYRVPLACRAQLEGARLFARTGHAALDRQVHTG